MAWSPVRRINAGLVRVEAPGDYATFNSNQLRDGTEMHHLTGKAPPADEVRVTHSHIPTAVAFALLIGATAPADAVSPAPAEAGSAMVVTSQHLASEVGAEILKAGGNAVDAAVAVGYALDHRFHETDRL
jgi:hypothetical protein